MSQPQSELEQIKGLGAERCALFAQHGLTTLQQLVDADRHELDLWLDPATNQGGTYYSKSTPYYIGQWQAEARTLLYHANPQPPKWFTSLVDLSVESVVPNYTVKPGGRVDLWFKSDAEIARMVRAGEIEPLRGDTPSAEPVAHLLSAADWLSDDDRKQLALGGIYTAEALADPARRVEFMGEQSSLADFMKARGLSAQLVAHARSSMAPVAATPEPKE